MGFSFFFGPDKTPFALDDNGVVEATSTTPFHGIISRGLLSKLKDNNVSNEVWYKNAHLLEREDLDCGFNAQDLLVLKEYAAECKVLSFTQSAACVKLYVEKHFGELVASNIAKIEIWNIKEGYTSSVWKVLIISKDKIDSFAVNIARDQEAGIALKKNSEKMKTISRQFPVINLAKVLDTHVLGDRLLPSQVIITLNEWIDNSYEIHSRKHKQTGKNELLLVEQFLTSEDNPVHITSVSGRLFTSSEVKIIQSDINQFLTKAAACLPEKPEININHGDVVWNGKNAIVVALS